MRWIFRFIAKDVTAQRTLFDVGLGASSIAVCAVAMSLVLVFTDSVQRFVNHCFLRSRPVIGSIFVEPVSRGLMTADEERLLKQITDEDGRVESVSWITQLYHFRIQRNGDTEFHDDPKVWGVPFGTPLMDPANGLHYVSGGPFEDPGRDSPPRFEVMVNTKFLEDFLGYTEEEVQAVTNGSSTDLPQSVFVHFPPITFASSDEGAEWRQEPGTIEIPISGVFAIRDENFPDLVFNQDVTAAYLEGQTRWHPTFTTQFVNTRNEPLFTMVDPPEDWYHHIRRLPQRHQLIACDFIREAGNAPGTTGVLSVKDYRTPGIRAEIKKSLERDIELFSVQVDSQFIERLNSNTRYVSEELVALFNEHGISLSRDARFSQQELSKAWAIRQKEPRSRFRLESNGSTLTVVRESPWNVRIPSDTVSKALNQVDYIIAVYASAIYWIVFLLSGLISMLLGISYIDRRRKDIGVLKTSGISVYLLGLTYSLQVLLVSMIGVSLGLILSWMVYGVAEGWVYQFVERINPEYATTHGLLQLTGMNCGTTISCVMLGSSLGTLVPCWRAISVDPIEDLKTGV